MSRYSLTRRSILAGLGGAAAAIPTLEATGFRGTARAQDAPKRFVVMYAGVSPSSYATDGNVLIPTQTGAGYDLPRALLPLGNGALPYGGMGHDVQSDVSIVSGLRIPWDEGSGVPPGGRSVGFHYNTMGPQLNGMRGRSDGRGEGPGTTADQLVADAISGGAIHRLLHYRVQAARYIVGSNSSGGGLDAMSLRLQEGGSLEPFEATVSPRLAYESLFSGFTPPDTGERESFVAAAARRRSVLAAVRARTAGVMPKLGVADRQRMERHLDELRAFESRLNAVNIPTQSACTVPTNPGEDPPISEGHETQDNGNLQYTPGRGYSDEERRGNLLVDLVGSAFRCDLARVAAIRISLDQSFLNMAPAVGAATDAHESTHQGNVEWTQDTMSWHVKFFSRLVRQLRDTTDLDGSSLLDNTTVILLFEGGWGYDPEGQESGRSHSTENMAALVAGRLGGLRGGQHIVADGRHPAHVMNTLLTRYGLPDRLGEVEGTIGGLT